MIKVKIEEVLEDRDLSIYWLANESGLSYSAAYRLVKDRTTKINFNTLAKVMIALDIEDFNEILELTADRIPSSE